MKPEPKARPVPPRQEVPKVKGEVVLESTELPKKRVLPDISDEEYIRRHIKGWKPHLG